MRVLSKHCLNFFAVWLACGPKKSEIEAFIGHLFRFGHFDFEHPVAFLVECSLDIQTTAQGDRRSEDLNR